MKPVAAIALAAALPTMAATTPPARAEQLVVRCFFDWVCDPNRKCVDAGEDVRFRVDTEAQTVSRIGGNDLSTFELLIGDRALSVLEKPISGGTVTTTFLLDSGSAVHSENLITGRDLTPRQFLGECNAL